MSSIADENAEPGNVAAQSTKKTESLPINSLFY